jgi:hypothetical protein
MLVLSMWQLTLVAAETSDPVDLPSSLRAAPWYDSEAKQIRPLEFRPRVDDSIHRDSRWLPKPKKLNQPAQPQKTSANQGTGGNTGSGLFGSSFTLGNLFAWILLGVTLLAIVGLIVYAISRAEMKLAGEKSGSGREAGGGKGPDRQTLERIKHLPAELRRTDVNLRTECERLMGEGHYDQAIILLLGHQLLLLDKHGLLRLSRGKTNGRYVRETRTHHAQCALWLRETADAFEQSYFGRYEIAAEVFEQLWQQNSEMETAATQIGAEK